MSVYRSHVHVLTATHDTITLRFLRCESKAGNRTLTAVSALPSYQSSVYIQAHSV